MKTLIAYYSFTDNNAKLAKHLQQQLNADIVRIETEKRRNGFSILLDLIFKRKPQLRALSLSLKDYDHIVLVAPIWAGKVATPLKAFLVGEKQNIRSYSFVSLCGGGNPNQLQDIQEEVSSVVQRAPLNVLELWVNDLLPPEKRNTIKYTSGFRIEDNGFALFQDQIQKFVRAERRVIEEPAQIE